MDSLRGEILRLSLVEPHPLIPPKYSARDANRAVVCVMVKEMLKERLKAQRS